MDVRQLRQACAFAVAICAGFAAFENSAQAGEAGVGIRYFTKMPAGTAPYVEFEARVPMTSLLVRLQRDDGKTVDQAFGPLGPGDRVSLKLDGAPGQRAYKGEVVVGQGPSNQSSALIFETQVTDTLAVFVNKADVDLAGGRMKVSASRPMAKIDVTAFASLAAAGQKVTHNIDNNHANEPVSVAFPTFNGSVARLDVVVTDTQGFYNGVSLSPWSVFIPHEEVIFATGQAKIEPSEQPKLDASAKLIADAFAKSRMLGPVQLFIAGHTDTVGNETSNANLSLARAHAIATYLRKKGLRLPVLFEGFGERALRVGTPDETDEARNRRVDYVLALEPPTFGNGVVARWKKLR